jgi:nitrile hydratase subunit beta
MNLQVPVTAPLFKPGDMVRIPLVWPEQKGPCHIRTPAYIRGHSAQIICHFGAFPNPEELAFGKPAQLIHLYHVAVSLSDLWDDDAKQDASLLIEIYEHWLEKLSP